MFFQKCSQCFFGVNNLTETFRKLLKTLQAFSNFSKETVFQKSFSKKRKLSTFKASQKGCRCNPYREITVPQRQINSQRISYKTQQILHVFLYLRKITKYTL